MSLLARHRSTIILALLGTLLIMFLPGSRAVNAGDDTDLLTVEGLVIDPAYTQLSLHAGWNLAGYWRTTPLPIATALASVEDELLLVKDNDGRVYWPALGIYQIEETIPGQGYQLYMTNPAVLIYPANE